MRRLAAAALLAVMAAAPACHSPREATPAQTKAAVISHHAQAVSQPAARELEVRRDPHPVDLDGELDEGEWPLAARTGGFRDPSGALARPYSEVRFLWRGQTLWLALHAADGDIRDAAASHDAPQWLGDAFTLRLAPDGAGDAYVIDVSPSGAVSDARVRPGHPVDTTWESGAKVAVDVDGTANDPSDDDEEWFVELGLPLAALGVEAKAGTALTVSVRRCDAPRATPPRCASARAHLTLSDRVAQAVRP